MSRRDFLSLMEASSRERLLDARRREPEAAMRSRAADAAPPRTLVLSGEGFDVIAEIKRRSPARGPLGRRAPRDLERAGARARVYAEEGAAAISVVTEPSAFGGDMADLVEASSAAAAPVMRKDFLVDPYQVFEARAHGADGVLLVARILPGGLLAEMADAAAGVGMFALLEAFGPEDAARSIAVLGRGGITPLLGFNARDLATLDVSLDRLEEMSSGIPSWAIGVAESGVLSPADAARCAAAGYRAALVGAALMDAPDVATLLRQMLVAGRASRAAVTAAGEARCGCE